MKETVTLLTQQAITTSGNGPAVHTPRGSHIAVQIYVSAFSGTAPTVTFYTQWSEDGTVWFFADASADSFTQVAGSTSAAVKAITPKGSMMRLGWTITGTTPSYTVKAVAVGLSASD